MNQAKFQNKNKRTIFSRIRKITCILLCFPMLVSSSYAQEDKIDPALLEKLSFTEVDGKPVVKVDLKMILEFALTRANTMKILELQEQIALESLEIAKESFNPTFSSSATLSRSVSGARSAAGPYFGLSASNSKAIVANVSKRMESGIVYGLNYQKIFVDKSQTSSITEAGDKSEGWTTSDDDFQKDSLKASVSIPIWQGSGDVNRIPEFKGEVGLEQAKIQSKQNTEQLLTEIANIYWNLVGINENIKTMNTAVKLAEQFYEDSKTKMELGVMDQVEVKQSETQLATVKQNLQQILVQQQLVEDQLRAALNLEDVPYGYLPTDELEIKKIDYDFKELLGKVLENDEDLALKTNSLRSNDLDMEAAMDGMKTDLDFNLSYTLNGYGDGVPNSTKGLFDTNLQGYEIGVTWNVPLQDRATPKKIEQIRLQRETIRLNMSDRKIQLTVSLQSALRNLRLREKAIQLAQVSVALQKELLEKETEKFKLGTSTSFRVSQLQQDYSEAQQKENQSRIDYEKEYFSFLVLKGDLFSYYSLPGVDQE